MRLFLRSRGAQYKRWWLRIALGLAVGVTLVAGVRSFPRLDSPSAGVHSIAVLPFGNLSRDADQDFFSDGTTQALTDD